ncbi:hypothetical protein [Pseudocitrobacter corydidari]|uniref:Lipoprotein n=1 Tax=Pseudocitrobacter corydidari TaxID=2891570 RepID=A0ABY3S475_9ENTR|nr:hypothetical protein [Pseudocitrobacter corydidari]UGS40879.1 hypothetical protein G163CM_15780 [Pseudocitrobacter corydidari]
MCILIKHLTCNFLLILILSILAGCSSFKGGRLGFPYNNKASMETITKALGDKVIQSQSNLFSPTARNEFITAQIMLIDIDYIKFISEIAPEQANMHTVTDILSLSTGLAATTFTPVMTKTILSAITTALVGYRSAIDNNIYYNQTINSLISTMNAERNRILSEILKNMAEDNISKYSFVAANHDIQNYRAAGLISTAAGIMAKEAKEKETASASLMQNTIANLK